ncbi:glutamate ABC transporter substrate-binding protein [Candidimonas nitroreducens]|uniref:ABC transporter substrate-binding protein n=1 Tax=Candidimonas nitroreducens TaxID=683354 RepID=A0A225MY94_9BURK|nr:glutamate ABC transporter substrate-binding protein [Candidimonas nitroreducens]OWT66367.1 ABC transporter substrate-binding protein [Candidimonas nitroreducens]
MKFIKPSRIFPCLAVAAALALGGSAGAFAASAVKQYPPDTTMGKIQKRGKLIVGVKVDFPLFGLRNPVTGKLEGMDIQLAHGIAKDLTGSPDNIEFVEVNSGNREVFLQQHKVDIVIATYPPNAKRVKAVDFAGPYLMSPIGTMVNKDNTSIKQVSDLNGKNICVTKGSGSETYVPLNAPKAKLTVFSSMTQCMEALAQRRVDGVTTTQSILLGQMSQNPGKFKLVPTELLNTTGKKASDNDSIGLPKGDKALHDYLDSYLKKIAANGEWKKIYDSTLGTVMPGNVSPPPILY